MTDQLERVRLIIRRALEAAGRDSATYHQADTVLEALRPELEDAKRWVEEERAIALYSCELKDFGGCGPVVLCPPCEARASIKRREDAAARQEK